MKSLYRCVTGLDVHRMLYLLTVLMEQADGSLHKPQRLFTGFQREVGELVAWLQSLCIEAMAPYRDYWQLLQTIPGIDQISAALILVENGDDLSAFANAKHLASWAALCPGNHESGGNAKPARPTKAIMPSAICSTKPQCSAESEKCTA
jgi:transposase